MVHEPPLLLERQVVDPLAFLGRPEREQREDLGLAAREERGAVRARSHVDLAADRADLLRAAPVRATLLDCDPPAHEILVGRLGGLLDELLGHRVLDRHVARLAAGGDRERQLELVDDAAVEQVALGGL